MSVTKGHDHNHAASAVIHRDVSLNSLAIPRLPDDSKILLLDIMGCTTSINSFQEEMIPFISRQITSYVDRKSVDDMQSLVSDLNCSIDCIDDEEIKLGCLEVLSNADLRSAIISCMKKMKFQSVMKNSITVTFFLANIWADGFDSGNLKGHLFEDVLPLFQWCQEKNVSINIYSGGSVQLQKSLFSHSPDGDLTSFIQYYFDLANAGLKDDPSSYVKIASEMGVNRNEIMFVSNSEDELIAAREAGIGHTVMCVRPGNATLTSTSSDFPMINSLLQLCGIEIE